MSFTRSLAIAAALAFVVSLVPASAQQQTPAPTPASAHGQLVRVDTSAKTILIRTDANAQMTFSYNDATKVTGSEEDVAGLATMSGTEVTVQYRKDGQTNMATQIEVMKKPSA